MLTVGWHSGAVFGPSASAAAASKLLGLSASQIEDALGIACTQACGLMSAQFESEVKRMQHGFAARNGLLGALLARGGYIGIKKVYEREFGGFLEMFGKGSGRDPKFLLEEVTKGLGQKWQTEGVRVKPYAAMAATHASVDCVRKLQEEHPEEMKNLDNVEKIELRMGEAAFHHGGFKASRPLTSVGAQMSASYVAVTQMVDREVLTAQFRHDMLERDDLWKLVDKTNCILDKGEGPPGPKEFGTRIDVTFKDGKTITADVKAARGVDPAITNEEIVEKWRGLCKGAIDDERREKIEKLCLGLEDLDDVIKLEDLMAGLTKNPIA
jgi:aconitate decarboxylase